MAPSQKPFYIALGVVVIGGAAFIASRMMGDHNVSIPANVVVTAADTTGFHGYTMGSPTAPVEVVEYGDLECPNCASFATVQFPDIKARLIDPGKVLYRYRDFPLDGPHKHPRVSAHAAACADEQGKYWEVQDAMFRRQTDYALADNPMGPLADIMKGAGLNVDAWTACMKSAKFAGRIQASANQASALGMNGTPSFLIAGRIYSNMASETMVKLVDSLIAAGPAAAKPTGAPKPTGGQ
jgi:protein-disulfide isomerase